MYTIYIIYPMLLYTTLSSFPEANLHPFVKVSLILFSKTICQTCFFFLHFFYLNFCIIYFNKFILVVCKRS